MFVAVAGWQFVAVVVAAKFNEFVCLWQVFVGSLLFVLLVCVVCLFICLLQLTV